ncbi:putative transcription regulator mTERF family [Helianthus annuus]|uniref:Putative transcription termination factor n=1 Tax=Helianthus annuus TaxID=4232 RepID=A0A251UMT2_HELAN|nr:uncharacterized protein LOC110939930 [Helianthus annuus]KAF5804386.1 putative transcription regulator mTERF family [Helianthus annuus]KAJ0583301.1 putative transcription regulator mTERF family [Helianthus annuus]KAJ0746037.1 putative transcription regulator mTERF family [Helianthus annuus]KAJ0749040.1 putative transcription regulator mTERF family [Helianthus annuus]KAJ0917433.1 putative transcription regulator mTERF family [Helianthus annuus]
MFTLISKQLTFSALKSPSIHRSLSSSTTTTNLINHNNSFTVSYLINSCGFPLDKAISASKFLNFKTPDKPDSVIQFFKSQGFTQPQISHIISKFPLALSCHPEKNLLPKFQFLTSLGLTSSDLVKILTARPKSLGRSLKNHLEPSMSLLRELLQSDDRTLIAIKRCAWVLDWDFQANMVPNMKLLRDVGVPGSKMMYVLTYQPRDFMVGTEQFKSVVDEVVGMGFDPTKTSFMLAVHAIRSMTKVNWEKKIGTYEKWGWSKDEILMAFRTDPWCMMKSEEKIDTVMDYLVNKMGFETSVVAKNSLLISLSMEKRIIPRCVVFEYCLKKGLMKDKRSFSWWLRCSESIFVKRLERYEKEAPGVLKLYRKKMDLAS